MVPITQLLVPIVLSAVIVFVLSSIIHMVLKYHRNDWRKLPAEDDIQAALRKYSIPPGDYMLPCGGGPEAMKSPEFIEKMKKGPVAFMTVVPSGPPTMTGSLIQWFLFCILVGITAAYIAGRALGPGAEYLAVFRFTGATAFFVYGLAHWPESIWYKRSWGTTLKFTFDGLIYGLFTGGTFGWLWPD